MKRIPLGRNGTMFALVDDEDFEHLSQFKWHMHDRKTNIYACRRERVVNSKGESVNARIYMHRVVMGTTDTTILVDHVDGNGLNCTKINLRECNASENNANRIKTRNKTTTNYKGVVKQPSGFVAQIVVDRRKIYLGTFDNVTDAARAYDIAAIKHFGEFAKCNFLNSLTKYKQQESA